MFTLQTRRFQRPVVLAALIAAGLAEFAAPHSADARRSRRRAHSRLASQGLYIPDSSRDTTRAGFELAVDRAVADAGGTMGISLVHLETGERLERNAAQPFFMASVFKVPIALRLLQRVEAGEISLADTVFLRPADLRTGSSPIAIRHPNGGRLTMLELFDAMLVDSDNTASDFLLQVAGGPGAVTARMRDLGVHGVRLDRSEVQMAFDYYGVTDVPPDSIWEPPVLSQLMNGTPYAVRTRAAAAFLDDPRDTATPGSMTQLLSRVWAGEALSAGNTALLLDAMERCQTGPGRIPALLPAGTRVAHKTGTWSSTGGITTALNDVGIVRLPGDRGHIAVAAFVKGSRRSNSRIEHSIARVARAAWDRWAPLQSELIESGWVVPGAAVPSPTVVDGAAAKAAPAAASVAAPQAPEQAQTPAPKRVP